MASREQTKAIVALLRQGHSSAEIAERINISAPVVWGVKAHWVQGKYGDKTTEMPDEGGDHVAERNFEQKAAAIFNGYFSKPEMRNGVEELLKDAALEFARLLALITSSQKSRRDSAKQAIRDYAVAGGWYAPPKESAEEVEDNSVIKDSQRKRQFGKWRIEDQTLLTDGWSRPDSRRDGDAIRRLSEALGRTPLAVIMRLHQWGMISVAAADALCLETEAPVLLSETNKLRQKDDEPRSAQEVGQNFDHHEPSQDCITDLPGDRPCISCGRPIPSARLQLIHDALRCARCQSYFEQSHDYHRYVDEGLAGTREAHKQMRGQDLRDIRNRGRE